MTRTVSFAIAAALIGFASPSFAGDDSLANLQSSSGHYYGSQSTATRFGNARAQATIRIAPRSGMKSTAAR